VRKIFELNLSLCKDYVPLELGGTVPILYTMALSLCRNFRPKPSYCGVKFTVFLGVVPHIDQCYNGHCFIQGLNNL
jgi:hypothetical protein